ncbi:MAG: cell division protein ZapB [Candidatus Aminicenantales bacterium]
MTTELERFKILEAKISRMIEFMNKLSAENERLKQQIKELKAEKKDMEELNRKAGKLDEELKRYENEREVIKGKIEALIDQMDKLGI